MEHVPMVGAYYSVATGAGPIGTVFFFLLSPFHVVLSQLTTPPRDGHSNL